MTLTLREIARALGGEISGGQVLAPGPGHSAQDRSLSVKTSEDAPGFVVHSFSNDDPIVCKDHVRARLGVPSFKPNGGNGASHSPRRIKTTSFHYRNPAGEIVYRKNRFELDNGSKSFAFDPPGRNGSTPLLYGCERLADLGDGVVFIVEGEGKVDRLRELGAIAVSCDSGAKSRWLPSHAQLLRRLGIILWPDSDQPGEGYISAAAAAIRAENPEADIRVVRPFGLPNGGNGRDVCDWAGDAAELAKLVDAALPYEPFHAPDEPLNWEHGTEVKLPAHSVKGGVFVRSYVPLSYAVEGVLPSGYLYGLTARRGDGKTAWLICATAATIKGDGEKILGFPVRQGRVVYVAKENPDDFKMKLAVNCYIHGVTWEMLDTFLLVLDGRTDSPEQICEALRIDAEANGGFSLALYDTFQAGFSAAAGQEFNDNAAVLGFIVRLRQLTEVIGKPAEIVAFHPTKNAGEEDLFPYGGGAIMNEIDGNLTLWKGETIRLSQNRVRGPEFEPRFYRIEKLSSPEIVDDKGRQILLPVMRPTTEQDVEERKTVTKNTKLNLLRAILAEPKGNQRDWAFKIGVSVSTVNGHLQALDKAGLVVKILDDYSITIKGKKHVQSQDDV
jgi:AAA domain